MSDSSSFAAATEEEQVATVEQVSLTDACGEGIFSGQVWLRHDDPQHNNNNTHHPTTTQPLQGRMMYTNSNHDIVEFEGDYQKDGFWKQGTVRYAPGDTYTGPLVRNQRHGMGVFQWKDGRVYEGEFMGNLRHGQGVYRWTDGSLYQGEFHANQRQGYGMYTSSSSSNGDSANLIHYQGEWKDGVYAGHGVYTVQDVKTYKGEFLNGMPHGQGVETLVTDGTVREGQWRNGKLIKPKAATHIIVQNQVWKNGTAIYRGLWDPVLNHPVGHGTVEFPTTGDCASYEGCFNRQGQYHGHGRWVSRSGDVYEGSFVKGKRHGKGQYRWKDGRDYHGSFVENVRHGKGTLTYPNNDTYDGEFKDGQRHGKGRFGFANGAEYQGEWINGMYEGQGRLVQADGSIYSGCFVKGQAHGLGTKVGSNGKVEYAGQWICGDPADQVHSVISRKPADEGVDMHKEEKKLDKSVSPVARSQRKVEHSLEPQASPPAAAPPLPPTKTV